MVESEKIKQVLGLAKKLAVEYYQLTQKPLGVTGEIAEYEAARLLGLDLLPPRTEGYDAVWPEKGNLKVQIKGRWLKSHGKESQKIGRIKVEAPWDIVILVLLNKDFDARAIYRADRPMIEVALKKPGSKSRNERGALSIYEFKKIGELIWSLGGETVL